MNKFSNGVTSFFFFPSVFCITYEGKSYLNYNSVRQPNVIRLEWSYIVYPFNIYSMSKDVYITKQIPQGCN